MLIIAHYGDIEHRRLPFHPDNYIGLSEGPNHRDPRFREAFVARFGVTGLHVANHVILPHNAWLVIPWTRLEQVC